jgi:serine/threonine protein kinase
VARRYASGRIIVSAPKLTIGHIVDGKYEIHGLLKHGGAVATYRAVMAPNLSVALKFYDPALEAFPDVVNALARCETPMSELPDDLVVQILDGGKDPTTGALYTVTHLDEAPSLEEAMAWGPLAPSEAVTLVHSLARALDAVHAHGIAHLSLKPTNLFVVPGPAHKVRLVDFATSLVHQALPTPQARAASAPWLAPEQNGDVHGWGPATDVFTCALLAFYALTGDSYWRSCQSAKMFDEAAWRAEMLEPRTPVSERAKELSVSLDGAVDAVFARALAASPEQRFQSVGQFADALDAAIAPFARTTSSFAPVAPSIEADPSVETFDEPGPTSTSAVILGSSLGPDAVRPAAPSETAVAMNVPPPPTQMGAVLADFETAATRRFPVRSASKGSTEKPPSSTAGLAAHVSVQPETAVAKRRGSLLWIGAAAAGVLIAAGIVHSISANKGSGAVSLAGAPSAPVPPPTEPEARPATTGAPSATENAAPSEPAAVEPRTRVPGGKSVPKTARPSAPAQARGSASPAKKPCSKSTKPCR